MTKIAVSALSLCLMGSAALAQSANTAAPAAPSAPASPAVQQAPAAQPAPTAAPAEPAIKRFKMGALLSQGYEIKAVTMVPQEVTSRLAEKPDRDGVLVTLQKGSTAATCLFGLAEYTHPALLDIVWCVEQK